MILGNEFYVLCKYSFCLRHVQFFVLIANFSSIRAAFDSNLVNKAENPLLNIFDQARPRNGNEACA